VRNHSFQSPSDRGSQCFPALPKLLTRDFLGFSPLLIGALNVSLSNTTKAFGALGFQSPSDRGSQCFLSCTSSRIFLIDVSVPF